MKKLGIDFFEKGAIVLVYKSAYKWEEGVCLGEVLDFPGTVSFGYTLEEPIYLVLAAGQPVTRSR
jgi:hypothetical protein